MANYLIIGASSGIGKGLFLRLAEQGHQVFATFNQTEIQEVHSLIHYFHLNVLDQNFSFNYLGCNRSFSIIFNCK